MNKLIFSIATLTIMIIASCNNSNFTSSKQTLTTKEVSNMLKDDIILLDVRNENEIAEQAYDVKNIMNIPLDSIEAKMNLIPKDKQVVLVCQSGNRSDQAYELLKKNGFTNISNMEGGMNAWREAGLPTKGYKTSANGDKKACCADPTSKDCNPDGTCKTDSKAVTNINDKVYVYAFHGTNQCTTCKNMKANTKETLDTYFAEELKTGKIIFQIVDVDDTKNEKLAEKFEATGTALMIQQIKNNKEKIVDLSDMAFEKANNKDLFIADLKTKLNELK